MPICWLFEKVMYECQSSIFDIRLDRKEDEEQNRSHSFVFTFKSAATNYLDKPLMEMRMKIIWLGLRWRGKCILPVKKPYNTPIWKAQRNILTPKKRKKKNKKENPRKRQFAWKSREKKLQLFDFGTSAITKARIHHINRASNYSTMREKCISILRADDSELISFSNVSFCFFRIVWNSLCCMSQLQKLYRIKVFRPIMFLG